MSDSVTANQISGLIRLIDQQGLTQEECQTLFQSGHLVDLMRSIQSRRLPERTSLKGVLGLAPVQSEIHRFSIDYGDLKGCGHIQERLIADGKYEEVNPHYTEEDLISLRDKEEMVSYEACLFYFGYRIAMSDARSIIAKFDETNAWIGAALDHQLGFAAAFPDQPADSPIVSMRTQARLSGVEYMPQMPILSRKKTGGRSLMFTSARRISPFVGCLAVRRVS